MYNDFTMNSLLCPKIKTKTKTCAKVLVETLIKLGANNIFGYPGASVLSIYNELSKTDKIKHYLVRHEQAALHAAEGYARVSGKTGVVLVTSGPGFTNTITGIANAYADSTPLVILAGDVSTNNKKGKIFQNVDILSLSKTCAKKCYILGPDDDIAELLEDAFRTAESGVKGPVVIAMPRNIIESEYKFSNDSNKNFIPTKQDFSSDIKKFENLISNAKKPIILVGGGAVTSAKEIISFAKHINCPVVSTLMGIGIFPSENPLYLGMIGMNGIYTANSALNLSDLVIALGVSFSDRSTCKNLDFYKKSKIISINISDLSYNFELEIKADIKDFLSKFLSNKINPVSNNKWLNQINSIRDEDIINTEVSDCLLSSQVLEIVSDYTRTYEPIVVTDVGQHQMLTAQHFNFNKPRKFITSGGLGTMGFGLPASIGAHIANPDNLILNITGDGSFQMNLQELATCREHNIPIKVIILNNGYLGMVRQMQEKLYNTRYQVEMTNPDFTKIAEAYDLFAVHVSKKEELIPALKTAIEYPGTAIIDIMINHFENI